MEIMPTLKTRCIGNILPTDFPDLDLARASATYYVQHEMAARYFNLMVDYEYAGRIIAHILRLCAC